MSKSSNGPVSKFSRTNVLTVQLPPPDYATKQFLAQDFSSPRAYVATLTPALAGTIYHFFNKRNRGISLSTEAAYEQDMSTGDWIGPTVDAIGFAFLTGQDLNARGELDDTPGIALDNRGHILYDFSGNMILADKGCRVAFINGQTRCAAATRSGTSHEVVFAVGLPLAARGIADSGKGRSTHEQMQLDGLPDAKRSDDVVRAIDYLLKRKKQRFSLPQIRTYLREWNNEISWVQKNVPVDRLYGNREIAAAFAFAWRAVRNDPVAQARITQAVKDLYSGVGLADDSAIRAFRDYCNNRMSFVSKRRQPTYLLTLRALNAIAYEIRGESLEQAKRRGVFPDHEGGYDYFFELMTEPDEDEA
jgi:hypothetical protein